MKKKEETKVVKRTFKVYQAVNRKRRLSRGKPKRLSMLGTNASLGQIARACRLSHGYCSRIFAGQRTPAAPTMARVAVYLGVTIDELYKVLTSELREDEED